MGSVRRDRMSDVEGLKAGLPLALIPARQQISAGPNQGSLQQAHAVLAEVEKMLEGIIWRSSLPTLTQRSFALDCAIGCLTWTPSDTLMKSSIPRSPNPKMILVPAAGLSSPVWHLPHSKAMLHGNIAIETNLV